MYRRRPAGGLRGAAWAPQRGDQRLLRHGGAAPAADHLPQRNAVLRRRPLQHPLRCQRGDPVGDAALPPPRSGSTRHESVQHLDFGRQRPFVFVTDADCSPTPAGDDNDLHTTVRLRLLYLDEEETPTVTERTAEVALPAVSRDAACALLGAPEVTFNGSGCDIRQTVSLRVPETGGQDAAHRHTWWSCSPTVSRGGDPLWSCAAWRRGRACGTWQSSTTPTRS